MNPESTPELDQFQPTPEQNGSSPKPELNGVNSNPEQDGVAQDQEPEKIISDQVLEPEGLDRELIPDEHIQDPDADTPGVNEPKPVRLEKALVSGKKRKGKRSGSRIVCSYDEMIEARPARLSDEEFDLEMEFSEFLN